MVFREVEIFRKDPPVQDPGHVVLLAFGMQGFREFDPPIERGLWVQVWGEGFRV